MPSAQDIQEQIKQQQLIGMGHASPQHPMVAGGNYGSFVPQAPFQLANFPSNERNPRGVPVNMGKLSLLAISFTLMLLGAFTFLGGFLLGIWVAGPRISQSIGAYLPSQQSTSYYPEERRTQQSSRSGENFGGQIGAATESAISEARIEGIPEALAPFARITQSQIGGYVGEKTGSALQHPLGTTQSYPQQQLGATQPYPQQQLGSAQSYPQQQLGTTQSYPQQQLGATQPYPQQQLQITQPHLPQQLSPPPPPVENAFPQPSRGPAQLPVVTPHTAVSSSPSFQAPPASEEGYTVRLGAYALLENANALMNHLQFLGYPTQVTQGKNSDGTPLYYVQSGAYKDYSTAMNAASQFASQNIPGAIVVKVSQQPKSAL